MHGAVGALALVGIAVAGVGIWYLRALASELSVATKKTAVTLDLVNAARARSWELVATDRGIFVAAARRDQAEIDALARQSDAACRRIGEQIGELRPLLGTETEQKELDRFESALGEFRGVSATYIRLCKENQLQKVDADIGPKERAFTEVADNSLTDLKVIHRNMLKDSQVRAESLQSQSLFFHLLATSALLAVAILSMFAVQGVCRTLVKAVGDISAGAGQVSAAASQVSSSSQSLAQGSSEQAAALQETSASSQEINSMVRQNSENSRVAAELMGQSQQKLLQANATLNQSVAAMAEIDTQSGKISKIIKVIDEIAFQTNILALNAAVEAARAGEAGLGFAVVADEVRNLAQRCAQAARDTAPLIEESIAKSSDGKLKVDQAALAIRTVTEEAVKVKTLVDEVNLGSQEQARGIGQIGKAIGQMQQGTEGVAASAEESAAAAEELNAQAEKLRQIAVRLTAMVGDGAVGG
jgi:methyl-accepting chemotaxis protein/methyl-accepting chemotaxis protein-1 (serine sensor receptor)